jgi:hypothetical protein
MSNKYKTPARKVRASAIEKSVLNILADHADDSGRSFPSVKTIALGTGFGETSVMTAVRQLEEEGLLRVERQHGEVNHYFLNLAEIEERAKSGRATRDDEERRCKREGAGLPRPRARKAECPSTPTTSHSDRRSVPAGSGFYDLFVPPPIGDETLWWALIASRRACVADLERWREQASEYCDNSSHLDRALLFMILNRTVSDLFPLSDVSSIRVIARAQVANSPAAEKLLM